MGLQKHAAVGVFWGESKFLEAGNKIKNLFWKGIFDAAAKLIRGNNYKNPDNFQLSSIVHNPLIKIGNKVINRGGHIEPSRSLQIIIKQHSSGARGIVSGMLAYFLGLVLRL